MPLPESGGGSYCVVCTVVVGTPSPAEPGSGCHIPLRDLQTAIDCAVYYPIILSTGFALNMLMAGRDLSYFKEKFKQVAVTRWLRALLKAQAFLPRATRFSMRVFVQNCRVRRPPVGAQTPSVRNRKPIQEAAASVWLTAGPPTQKRLPKSPLGPGPSVLATGGSRTPSHRQRTCVRRSVKGQDFCVFMRQEKLAPPRLSLTPDGPAGGQWTVNRPPPPQKDLMASQMTAMNYR